MKSLLSPSISLDEICVYDPGSKFVSWAFTRTPTAISSTAASCAPKTLRLLQSARERFFKSN